ncbi:MAG TPA: hypothetical protein VK002_06130 [Rubricoccaceae bacterium]|jgi:hypothetical protein|nr:hypothetical protein [Rubricoccaceae bacterium]
MSATASSPRRHRTAAEVNAAGIDALVRALGVADAARFLQQYGPGLGDYTAERDALLEGLSMEDVLRLAEEHQRERGT